MKRPILFILVAVLACQSTPPEEMIPLPPPPGLGPFLYVDMDPDSALVAVGDTVRFRAVSINGQPPERTTWAASDTTIAVVDSVGLVTGRAPGTIAIRATATRGTAVSNGYARLDVRAP